MNSPSLVNLLISPPLWLAFCLALLIALSARAARWLTWSGAAATFGVGCIVFGLGGGKFAVPLLTFFISSSLLSAIARRRKGRTPPSTDGKTARSAAQVLANGGPASALVVVFAIVVHRWPFYETRTLLMLYLAALATVNADTWATEIGSFSRRLPRLLTNWKPVAHGASGAITALGLAAALVGAIVIPLSALALWHPDAVEFISVAWAGFLGSLADSVLGAGLQAKYRDPVTGELTEQTRLHGRPAVRVRGLGWVNNDTVNFLAGVIGVLCAWILLHFGAFPFH